MLKKIKEKIRQTQEEKPQHPLIGKNVLPLVKKVSKVSEETVKELSNGREDNEVSSD